MESVKKLGQKTEWLTVKEAAELGKCSEGLISAMKKDGRLQAEDY